MERTKTPTNNETQDLLSRAERLTAMSQIVNRTLLASKLGEQYEGDRDLYTALGWKLQLEFTDYRAAYRRQDIAKAVINRPIDDTWKDGFEVVETDDEETSDFEQAWIDLDGEHDLTSKFVRVDKLTALGRYGVLLLGLDDVESRDDLQQPVKSLQATEGGERQLLYVKPFSEHHAKINAWEKDPQNRRFGLPTQYEITMKNPGEDTESILHVHHSRVIHVTGELLESEVEGVPELEVIFNRLMDLEKILGGDAEGVWRGARPGYQAKVADDYELTPEIKDDLQSQLDEFEHSLRRMLMNEGVTWESLEQQVTDPSSHVDVQVQMISAAKKIPKRILTGSERGELASTEDKSTWNDHIVGRQNNHAELNIVRPFIDKCIEYGVLEEPTENNGEYILQWSDLWAPSEKEQAEVGNIRAQALANYVKSPMAMDIVPPKAFYDYILNLDPDQVELVLEQRDSEMNDEDSFFNQTPQQGNGQAQAQIPNGEGGTP